MHWCAVSWSLVLLISVIRCHAADRFITDKSYEETFITQLCYERSFIALVHRQVVILGGHLCVQHYVRDTVSRAG